MRVAHIEDAVMIYNTITRDHDNLAVEFIQPNEFGEVSISNCSILTEYSY